MVYHAIYDGFRIIQQNITKTKDFANYKDKALEISPTIVYASTTAVFWRHWLFWLFESLTIDIKTN